MPETATQPSAVTSAVTAAAQLYAANQARIDANTAAARSEANARNAAKALDAATRAANADTARIAGTTTKWLLPIAGLAAVGLFFLLKKRKR